MIWGPRQQSTSALWPKLFAIKHEEFAKSDKKTAYYRIFLRRRIWESLIRQHLAFQSQIHDGIPVVVVVFSVLLAHLEKRGGEGRKRERIRNCTLSNPSLTQAILIRNKACHPPVYVQKKLVSSVASAKYIQHNTFILPKKKDHPKKNLPSTRTKWDRCLVNVKMTYLQVLSSIFKAKSIDLSKCYSTTVSWLILPMLMVDEDSQIAKNSVLNLYLVIKKSSLFFWRKKKTVGLIFLSHVKRVLLFREKTFFSKEMCGFETECKRGWRGKDYCVDGGLKEVDFFCATLKKIVSNSGAKYIRFISWIVEQAS